MRFFYRWIGAFALVSMTYNTTDYSYVAWVMNPETFYEDQSLKFVLGTLFLIGYAIYIRATYAAMGIVGIAVAAFLVGAFGFTLAYYGIVDFQNQSTSLWGFIFGLSTIMAAGMTNAFFQKSISGQQETSR